MSEKNKRAAVQTPRWVWFMVWCWFLWFTAFVVLPRLCYRINYQQVMQPYFDNIPGFLTIAFTIVLLIVPIGHNLLSCIRSIVSQMPVTHAMRYLNPLLFVAVMIFTGAMIANHRYQSVDGQNISGHSFILLRAKNIFVNNYDYRMYWWDDSSGMTYLMGEYQSENGQYELEYDEDKLFLITSKSVIDVYEFDDGWVCEYAPTHYLCTSTQE